jgi:hypothetical protein
MTATIRITGLDEALRGLGIIGREIQEEAARRAALETIAIAKPEPAPSGRKQPFKSLKSQRYFFAALKSGAITVPYRRSHALQDAWNWRPAPYGADVENAHPHADITVAKATRSAYHKGTWKDEEQIARLAEKPARDAAEIGIIRLIAKADY